MPFISSEKKLGKQRDRKPQERPIGPRHQPRPLRLTHAKTLSENLGTPLFTPLSAELRTFLERLPELLDQVMPLRGAHRKDLPDAVLELSSLLTAERSGLALPYWSSPRLTSAYLRYFLPWNLIRLGRFLPSLPLPVPPPGALVLDLGSGPLTLPLALWLALPAWREIPLDVLAVDASVQPMELGRRLFALVASNSPWRIRTLRAPLHKALYEAHGTPFLITAGNVLNELAEHKERHGEASQAERLAEMAGRMSARLTENGAILCVEPGTRLGGTVLEQLRAGAMEARLQPVSPCPHDGECPLLGRRGVGSGWCHALMDNDGAPSWLQQLTEAAHLGKSSLSLAHMLLRRVDEKEERATESVSQARVLSDAFAVPGLGLARYACTGQGLVLLAASAGAAQGALARIRPSRPPRRDAKTGAAVMVIAEGS